MAPMPDDLDDLEVDAHRALLRDFRRALEDDFRTRDIWRDVGAEWTTVFSWTGSTLDRAQRNLDAVESRLDRLQATPPRPADVPAQKAKPAPPPEAARSLWDRLSDADEDTPPRSAPASPQRATRRHEHGPAEPSHWWPTCAVGAAALVLVLALLAWAWYSVP